MSMEEMELDDQTDTLEALAADAGLSDNFYFKETLAIYLEQIRIAKELKATIAADGVLVTKEYVKGRGNVYTHPAVKEYNSTVTAAHKTMTTLISIIKEFGTLGDDDEQDPLLAILGGDGAGG